VSKISVVMCFYNGEDFIREAIDSVLGQTATDWELLLVDDGSTDQSSGIARELARSDPRARYLRHPGHTNRGLASSRVVGSQAAKGKHLLFLDHDDVLDPDALERLSGVLDAQPHAAAVFAATRFWTFSPDGASSKEIQTFAPLRSGLVRGRRFLRYLIMSDRHHPHVCSTMFRRAEYDAARDAAGIWEDVYEDTALLMKLLGRADVYVLDEPVSDYRITPKSMSYTYVGDYVGLLRWAAREVPMDRLSRAFIHWRRMTVELSHLASRLRRGLTGPRPPT
jgi:glycosyltransferase involved in cell wall biosynthesis